MFTGQNPDLRPEKTEQTPFAAKAKDLGALRDAIVDAASVGVGLWLSYLFTLFYLAIAAGAVTHRDLLLENPVKLPFLNVELPLKAFFVLGPLVFLIVHTYVLLHFVLLAGKIGAFNRELQGQISGPAFTPESSFEFTRARLRRQLPSNIFLQSLAGPHEVRTGVIGFLLRRIIEISLVAGPIALLVLFQLQFLPYHSGWITWWQRIVVLIDLVLLWILWPRIARADTTGLRWRDFKRAKVLASLLVAALTFLLVFTIATFPGEWLDDNLPPVPLVPPTLVSWIFPNVQTTRTGEPRWATPHELLVAGKVNYVTGEPQSLWSNVLVLANFEVGDRVKFDTEGKIAISSSSLSLRGRSLEGAVLSFAHLRKADFTGAHLKGAKFSSADLREAKFECGQIGEGPIIGFVAIRIPSMCTDLQDAQLLGAQLQGASLSHAGLQGAQLRGAQLQGALLDNAQLQGAFLNGAGLQGAHLLGAKLQGAVLDYAQLQGAFLYGARLQGAVLDNAQLQGAVLDYAQLQGASLRHPYVWRTQPPSNLNGALVSAPEPGPKYVHLDCPVVECDWSETSYAALKSLIEGSVSLGDLRDKALQRIARLEKPPYVADEASAKVWTDLAQASAASAGSYFGLTLNEAKTSLSNYLPKVFKEIGCEANGAPYVIRALIPQLAVRQMAEVAAAFDDEAKCPGARGLSEENKAKLQEIRDRRVPAPAGPGTVAR